MSFLAPISLLRVSVSIRNVSQQQVPEVDLVLAFSWKTFYRVSRRLNWLGLSNADGRGECGPRKRAELSPHEPDLYKQVKIVRKATQGLYLCGDVSQLASPPVPLHWLTCRSPVLNSR